MGQQRGAAATILLGRDTARPLLFFFYSVCGASTAVLLCILSDLEAQVNAMANEMNALQLRLASPGAAAEEVKAKQDKMEAEAQDMDRSRTARDGAGRAGRVRYQRWQSR